MPLEDAESLAYAITLESGALADTHEVDGERVPETRSLDLAQVGQSEKEQYCVRISEVCRPTECEEGCQQVGSDRLRATAAPRAGRPHAEGHQEAVIARVVARVAT
ncbi:MAG: hypothetical protein C4521_05205 [Actinobacteria bacterium]|nr:MAG: hypothetical protein C4521_05205 [Actinomycetota bacterium]